MMFEDVNVCVGACVEMLLRDGETDSEDDHN